MRNIELQWLLCGLVPNYHSISDFRKNNSSGLKKLFKVFASFLKDADLIAGETIAIDGTKSRAHNSKKANFIQKKIDKHLAYIEEKNQQYLDELAQNDEKENLGVETFTALVDKGYHNGRKITQCKEQNIIAIVAHPDQGKSNENGTQPDYFVSKFIYNTDDDTYTCPANQVLKTTGRWHKKTRDRVSYDFKKYRTPASKECAVKSLCTSRTGGREIDRSQYADAVAENNQRYQSNAQLYRKRQEINEHIFGTIKRQ